MTRDPDIITADEAAVLLGLDLSVYFVVCLRCRTVKIGYSGDPWRRGVQVIRRHRIDAGDASRTHHVSVAGWLAGKPADERRLHRAFKHLALGGEWFRLDDDLHRLVALLCAAGEQSRLRLALAEDLPL